MSFRPSRNPPSTLSIRPPSPNIGAPSLTTPTGLFPSNNTIILASPRRAPLPPSPTNSTHSVGVPWLSDRSRSNSLDVPKGNRDQPPPVPSKGASTDKRLPLPPGAGGSTSPHRHAKGSFAGAYDNKLVSSTLSHLPPLPPLSPTPTGTSNLSHSTSQLASNQLSSVPLLKTPSGSSQISGLSSTSGRPSFPHPTSSGIVVLPNGTALSTNTEDRHGRPERHDHSVGVGRSIIETMAHSSPSSPWSLLTVHVLPLFAGSALKTPIEDLNHLCHSHIIATSQRAQPSRIVALLSSDFREFVASGMLTLKSKFETLEEDKILSRAASVWTFFWGQVLPYLEGVFLPFSQIRDLPVTSSSYESSTTWSSSPIPVRHILLSGFLLHILLPLLPRLIPLISSPTASSSVPPTTTDLQRILQMSLVLSTQARFSSFLPGHERRDEEIRLNVDNLGKTVRWRIQRGAESAPSPDKRTEAVPPKRMSLQRNMSMNNGRYRRKGWRASSNFGQTWGMPPEGTAPTVSRQQSDMSAQVPEQRWGRPRVDDDEDDDVTPGQSLAYPRNTVRDDGYTAPSTFASTAGDSTFTGGASTIRAADSVNTAYDLSQKTPQADTYARRPTRAGSDVSSDLTPVAPARR